MINRPRTARVLASLVAAMTVGAIILLALDSHPVPAGAFSLASYQKLNDVEELVIPAAPIKPQRWNSIEVYYSKTSGGTIAQLASMSNTRPGDVNFHFVVYNGRGGGDGLIESTQRWQQQWSCIPNGYWNGNPGTIRICVIADGQSVPATEYQIKRTAALADEICTRFNISSRSIKYPANWQL
jgi:hypothetical protein